jgi:hypothetical protein
VDDTVVVLPEPTLLINVRPHRTQLDSHSSSGGMAAKTHKTSRT